MRSSASENLFLKVSVLIFAGTMSAVLFEVFELPITKKA
jgi:hypothetical protein